MMKRTACGIIFFALFAAAAARATTNILYNGTFELVTNGKPNGWTLSGGGAFLYNAGTSPSGNMLGEDLVGVKSLCLQQNSTPSTNSYSVSQTTIAIVPGQYRIRLLSFRYKTGNTAYIMADRCMTSLWTEDGTELLAPMALDTRPYLDASKTMTCTRSFPMPTSQLGKPFEFRITQLPSLSETTTIYRAIDNVELQLYYLEVAAGTELVYTNGIMSAEQSIYVRENATLVLKAADGFETLPSVSLWDGAKIRIDCAGWKGGEATLATRRGFLGPLQGAALDDPLSRIELVNAAGATMTLSADGKSIVLSRKRPKLKLFVK